MFLFTCTLTYTYTQSFGCRGIINFRMFAVFSLITINCSLIFRMPALLSLITIKFSLIFYYACSSFFNNVPMISSLIMYYSIAVQIMHSLFFRMFAKSSLISNHKLFFNFCMLTQRIINKITFQLFPVVSFTTLFVYFGISCSVAIPCSLNEQSSCLHQFCFSQN